MERNGNKKTKIPTGWLQIPAHQKDKPGKERKRENKSENGREMGRKREGERDVKKGDERKGERQRRTETRKTG